MAETVSDIKAIPTDALLAELNRRGAGPRCRCGKWGTYIGAYDADGMTIRCHGCLKSIARCTC
jgi:hypothetical protein